MTPRRGAIAHDRPRHGRTPQSHADLTADEIDGAFLLFEDRMNHGNATPLHRHPDSDETMIVLEGEIVMHLDGEEHIVGPGGGIEILGPPPFGPATPT
jgi:mannose-6-phosphate isomerase-like protein (cupin superfamily)